MLDFIKKQLNVEAVQESDDITNDSLLDTDNSLITEYAHLFQELSDVSEEGNLESTSERGRVGDVSISLEDDVDIEPDIVEMNLMNGCSLTDIPKDAGSDKNIETESASVGMKTFDDFFEEMYQNSFRFERESEENHISRIRRKANEAYQEYVDTCYQEGLFGFGDMDINDPKVPAAIAFDFGTACGIGQMMVQVPFKYITTEKRGKRMITKDQYECAAMLVGRPDLMNAIIADAVSQFNQGYTERLGGKAVNEVLMFQFIGIPKQESSDEYKIYIAADTGIPGMGNFDMVYTITKPGRRTSNLTNFPGRAPSTANDGYAFTLVNPTENDFTNRFNTTDFLTKNECVQLEYVAARPRRFDESFYQEAIDFEEDSSSSSEETSSEEDTSSSNEEEKKDVDTNDVSDQIVDKLAENNDDKSSSEDEGESSDDDEGSDDEGATIGDDDDTSSEDDSTSDEDDSSVDDDLENLDSSLEDSNEFEGSTDDEGMTNDDIDNMTVEELLQQGQDKLKGMTLKELKKFVSGLGASSSDEDDSMLSVDGEGNDDTLDAGLPSNENPDDDDTDSSSSNDDIEQEAFILTAKNINSELDVNIRNCLGILNEADISSADIFKKFKKASKKLNRVSAKASNMSKVYTDDERKTIGDMNKALVNLTLELGSASKDVASIKEKMKAFVNAAAAVGKIVEAKKK
jgi:hypothetical protein